MNGSSISIVPVANITGLNHGIELSAGYLFALTQSMYIVGLPGQLTKDFEKFVLPHPPPLKKLPY